MEDIEELKLLEKILLLVKDYNDTYKPEIYDSKVDLKAVKRSWIKNEDYGTKTLGDRIRRSSKSNKKIRRK